MALDDERNRALGCLEVPEDGDEGALVQITVEQARALREVLEHAPRAKARRRAQAQLLAPRDGERHGGASDARAARGNGR